MDLVFKFLSLGLIPALMWVNSISVEVALLKRELQLNQARIEKVEAQQNKILELVKDNQIALKGMVVTMNFMKDILQDIKNAK